MSEPAPTETVILRKRVVRATSFRHDKDGDVLISAPGIPDIAIDDPLPLLAVVMAAIKFGHPADMLEAAHKMVVAFATQEPSQ